MLLEHFGEGADGGQPAAVFTGLDQAIDGKTVTRGGNYLIKVWRVGKAAAADAGGGSRVGTTQASGAFQPGQFSPAVIAEAATGGIPLAQRAMRGERRAGGWLPPVK